MDPNTTGWAYWSQLYIPVRRLALPGSPASPARRAFPLSYNGAEEMPGNLNEGAKP